MEVVYIIIAAAADITPDGRLHLMHGDLETIWADIPGPLSFPLCVVLKTVFSPDECNRPHEFLVEFTSPSGAVIEPGRLTVSVARPEEGHPHRKVLLGFQFAGANLPEAGMYTIRTLVDGREGKSAQLLVMQRPAPH